MSAEINIGPAGVTRLDPAVARGDDDAEPAQPFAVTPEEVRADAPDADTVADATGAGLAARMRAKREARLGRAKWFDVPGWGGDLQVQARPFKHEREIREGVRSEKFIIGATHAIRYRESEGDPWEEIPGKWSKGFAALIGADVEGDPAPASALVREVVARKVGDEWLPNPAAVHGFAVELLTWMAGEGDEADDELGES